MVEELTTRARADDDFYFYAAMDYYAHGIELEIFDCPKV